jgi:Tfp pilus assembly protein PilF
MGFVQMALGNIKSAREDLERSLQIDPTLELSRTALSQLPK